MNGKSEKSKTNSAKTQRNITNTLCNMEAAQDMMVEAENQKTKRILDDKNKNNTTDLKDMRKEIKNESKNSQKGYE